MNEIKAEIVQMINESSSSSLILLIYEILIRCI